MLTIGNNLNYQQMEVFMNLTGRHIRLSWFHENHYNKQQLGDARFDLPGLPFCWDQCGRLWEKVTGFGTNQDGEPRGAMINPGMLATYYTTQEVVDSLVSTRHISEHEVTLMLEAARTGKPLAISHQEEDRLLIAA